MPSIVLGPSTQNTNANTCPQADGTDKTMVSVKNAHALGFSSPSFSLENNISLGDPRKVDTSAIGQLMAEHGLGFDAARLRLVQEKMKANGIDPKTGLSMDPRAVLPK